MSEIVVARMPLRAITTLAAASIAACVCLPRRVGNCSRGLTGTGDDPPYRPLIESESDVRFRSRSWPEDSWRLDVIKRDSPSFEFELGGISHVALVCAEMERTVDLYNNGFAMPLIKSLDLP